MRFTKAQRRDRKTERPNGWRYCFWVYNPHTQQSERVPVSQLPNRGKNFNSDEDAKEFCDTKSAEEDAVIFRIKKRQDWATKFYDFQVELEDFAVIHKVNASNSWKTDVDWLKNYVFPFFLGQKQANNVNNWSLYFQEFRQWMLNVKPLKGRKPKSAYNSVNKAIKALNRFLAVMIEQGRCKELAKYPVFPKYLCRKKTAEEYIESAELTAVHSALMEIRPESADLFLVLRQTALRENEALGLCVSFVKWGLINGTRGSKIHEALARYGLDQYYGFVCLESQPSVKSIRDKLDAVPRKPLKHRREVGPKSFRYIPISDKTVWNILVRRWNISAKAKDAKKFGDDERNYLLFDGLTSSKFYGDLQKAYSRAKVRFRSAHALRHTFLTDFYDKTFSDLFLAERVAGHRDKATMEIYSHAAEQRGLELRGVAEQRHLMVEVA